MKLYVACIVVLGLLVAVVSPAAPRKWTDDTGRYSVEAELVDVKDGKVVLRKADGTTVEVPLDKLSAADREYLRQAKAAEGSVKKAECGAVSPQALIEMAKRAVDEDDVELLYRCHCPPSASASEEAVARGDANFLLAHKYTRLVLDKAETRFPGSKLDQAFGEASLFFDRDMLLKLQFEHMVKGEIEITGDKAYVRYKRDGGTRISKRTLVQREGRWTLSVEGSQPEQTEHCAVWLKLAKTALAALDTADTFEEFAAEIAPQVQELAELRKAASERAREGL
jgi:hypothetical protein